MNLRDSGGQLVQKPTRFVTTAICVANALSLGCSGRRDHAPVKGRAAGESGRLGALTAELAHRIILGILQQMTVEHDEKFVEAFPAGDEDAKDEEEPDEHHEEEDDPGQADVEPKEDEPPAVADMRPEQGMARSAGAIFDDRHPRTFKEWRQVTPTLRSAIRKLNEQYSHALYGDDLARHIRLGGGAPRAIAAAKLFRCERCAEAVRPPSRPIAGIPPYTRHNECIGIDVIFIPDMKETFQAYLLMEVDVQTRRPSRHTY